MTASMPIPEVPAAPPPVQAPSSSDPTTAGAVAQQNYAAVSGKSKVSSLNELKEKAPEVYRAMVEGIATTICEEMKRNQEHLKKIMDDARRNS